MTMPKAPAHELGLKDALVHAGLLDKDKAGRGRPSRQMTEQGEMLVAEHGYRIKGMVVAKTKVTAKPEGEVVSTSTPAPTVERVKRTTGKEIAELIPQMRGDDIMPIVNGKPWKMGIRGICQNCGVSLTHCPCVTPIVWADFQTKAPVTFAKK